ncbi:MAG: M20/M25/M40 family metallo-hydrolase, partial [Planctomycetota bacterium]
GLWGGRVPNPINELVGVLAQLKDTDGRVTVPGFYDGVRDPNPEELAQWGALGIDAGEQLALIGLPPEADVGERGHGFVARGWARPTCDINGIVGGYTGEGAKTVIPGRASAKLSFRLVDEQDPERIRDAVFDWFRERTPPGCRWELDDHGVGPGATVAIDSPALTAARAAMGSACGVEPALIRSGGSIPVAGMLKEMLGIETVFMGFGLDDDRVHSPNEKFELECWRQGARSHAALPAELWAIGGR